MKGEAIEKNALFVANSELAGECQRLRAEGKVIEGVSVKKGGYEIKFYEPVKMQEQMELV